MKKILVILLFQAIFLYGKDYYTIDGEYFTFENYHIEENSDTDKIFSWPLFVPKWNNKILDREHYSIMNYRFNWYKVTTYYFQSKDIYYNGKINIGMEVQDVIEILGRPDVLYPLIPFHMGDEGYIIKYGDDQYHGINSDIMKLEIFLDTERKVSIIRYNIIEEDIDEIFPNILFNEWRNYPTDFPQWILEFYPDNTVVYKIKVLEENDYEITDGKWEIFYENGIPKIIIKRHMEQNISFMEGTHNIYRYGDGKYCIQMFIHYYFYPYNENEVINLFRE